MPFVTLHPDSKTPLYQQLYEAIREAIESGTLPSGSKMPSIRRLPEELGVSRTTVESAYQQLCVEGYLKSWPQRGYYVASARLTENGHNEKKVVVPSHFSCPVPIQYDFGTDRIDSDTADITIWKRHIRDVLNRPDSIVSYGNPQGEPALRESLSSYTYRARGVRSTPEQIVIGAGIQPLLTILCGLLPQKQVAMDGTGFLQAERAFADCGVEVVSLPDDGEGLSVEALYKSGVHQILVSPSAPTGQATAMPPSRRFALLQWAREKNGLIIEDDYNGELRYTARPIPALQGSGAESTVYLGSFSKLLLPSVRISYMVLPSELLQLYAPRARAYNQTASKIEQLALADYIKEGQLERHLRRMRKLYYMKSQMMLTCIRKFLGEQIAAVLLETALAVVVQIPNAQEIVTLAEKQGIRITAVGKNFIRLGFSGIPLVKIPAGIEALCQIIQNQNENRTA